MMQDSLCSVKSPMNSSRETIPLVERIEHYWTDRSTSYAEQIRRSLGERITDAYRNGIDAYLPAPHAALSVLDIGCGPGFFPRLFADRDYRFTCIDYSEGMLERAQAHCEAAGVGATFLKMDAQNLDFVDGSFDLVVSRNVTWTLPHPEKAYREWLRVLKPGGALFNFDANWYGHLFDQKKRNAYEEDRMNAAVEVLDDPFVFTDTVEMESIAAQLPLGRYTRPLWDATVLLSLGCTELHIDGDFWNRAWTDEEKTVNASTPGFMVVAKA